MCKNPSVSDALQAGADAEKQTRPGCLICVFFIVLCLCCVLLLLQTIMQSFLGVGAPEAILVAVVALVVFGPKGLADVRRQQQQH